MNFRRKFGFTASPVGGWFQAPTATGASQVRNPKPFTVFQPIPARTPSRSSPSTPIRSNRPARSSRQRSRARPSLSPSRSTEQADDPRHQARPSRDGLSSQRMQKAIRRGIEREAMEFAVELMHTSKAFHSMVCNRLEVICHEDLDTLAAPHGSCRSSRRHSHSRASATARASAKPG